MIEENLLSKKPVILSREQDIKYRGKNHLVHDYDGKVVYLKDADEWNNFDGDYIEPRSYEEQNIIYKLITNFFKLFNN